MEVAKLADEELLELIRAGKAEAFEAIYDRHVKLAYSLAFRICQDRGAAEEVTQDSFLRLWRSAGTYQPAKGSVRSWLLTITHHRAIDYLRKSIRVQTDQSLERVEIRNPVNVETEVIALNESQEIRKALIRLPKDQRGVIELAYFGGFTHHQIAELIDIPLGTVKGRMRLGLRKLKLNLEETHGRS